MNTKIGPGLTRFRKTYSTLNEISVVQGDKMVEDEEEDIYSIHYTYSTRCISFFFFKSVQLTSSQPTDTKYRERGENMAHNSGFPPLLRTRGRHLPFPQFFFV